MSVTVSKLSPSSNLQNVLFLCPKDVRLITVWSKTFTFRTGMNSLMEVLRQKRLERERGGWDVDHRGEEKLSEGLDRHFLFLLCCLTLFGLVVHVSSSSFCLSFNRRSWMLSVEVQIRVERLSEMETAKKNHLQILFPLKLPLSVSAAVFSGDRQIWGSISDANVNERSLLQHSSKQDWR